MCICKAPPLQRLRGRYEPIKVGLCSSPSPSLIKSFKGGQESNFINYYHTYLFKISRASATAPSERDKILYRPRLERGGQDGRTYSSLQASTANLTGALPLPLAKLPARKKHIRRSAKTEKKRRNRAQNKTHALALDHWSRQVQVGVLNNEVWWAVG